VYTQCPQCQTLYRVTAELLRAARGQVQCGRCAAVFDALTFLVEDAALEGGAQEPDSATAQSDDIPDRALEFDLPADAVDRVFIEGPKITMPSFPSAAVLTDAAVVSFAEPELEFDEEIPLTVQDSSNDPVAIDPAPETFDEPPVVEDEETWDPNDEPVSEVTELDEDTPTQIVESDDGAVIEVVDAGESANEDRGGAGFPRSRHLSIAEDSESDDRAEFGDTSVLRERAAHYGWRVGAAALLVLLFAQFVHYDRHDLVRRQTLGPLLQKIYSRLGLQLSPHWNLKAYQVRQWGAAAAPGAQGTLRVRASVVNTADHDQPLPLLRLSLADLAGARVGVRDFEPREYVPSLPESDRMLGAGRRVDAEVVIVDPGKEAVGFEIDVCLRDDEHHIKCANDSPPPG
jgi:predicted Zn finger-like uncharacterized protein